MNKNDLIDSLIEEHDLTKTFARDFVDSVFGSIADAAKNGEEVSIFGFGKFRVSERGARKGRNPQTGEAIKIAASKRLKFKPAKAMKTALNSNVGRKRRPEPRDGDISMSKKPTGVAAGNSEAIRIYERMEEERQRKALTKAEANKPKKVTLPRLKFLDQNYPT